MTHLPVRWEKRLKTVTYALQPIVNIRNGVCFSYEALLRNYREAGFDSISGFFDQAFTDGILAEVDLELRKKAVKTFRQLPWHRQSTLFYNVDTRLWDAPRNSFAATLRLLQDMDFPLDSFCLEVSESQPFNPNAVSQKVWAHMKQAGLKVAVDDCGVGFSGLKLIYYTEPHFVKVDRFFVSDLAESPKKRLFVSQIVNIAHRMGSIVVAEGVETEREVLYCREIGCDMLQGYFVERPCQDTGVLKQQYDHIAKINQRDRRSNSQGDRRFIQNHLRYLLPVFPDSDLLEVMMRFKDPGELRSLPVVNRRLEPLGIICEDSIKPYAYSEYGRYLLQNPTIQTELLQLTTKCPIADLQTPVDDILELFVQDEAGRGILIVDQFKYVGFLNDRALLKALNERNLVQARDQNPLTKLPGNPMINQFLSAAINDSQASYSLVYFDFDNFKPYNDRYGFRSGDRVIQLFGELLRARQNKLLHFIGHIGGDDFFLGLRDWPLEKVRLEVQSLQNKFASDVESFYDEEDRVHGYIAALDREGSSKRFPLLTVSGMILHLAKDRKEVYSLGDIGRTFAELKKQAKDSPERLAISLTCGESH